ncbi:MAG: sugar transferase [Bryobacteraceae bacterium]
MIRLFRVFVPVGALALLFSEILIISAGLLIVTILVLNVDPAVFLFADNGLLRVAIVAASILFGLFFEDLYTHIHVKSKVLLIQQLCMVMGIALLIQGFISYVNAGYRLPIRVMIPAGALIIAALFAWRLVYSAVVLGVVGAQRILLVGMSPLVAEMAAYVKNHTELGMHIVGCVDNSQEAHPAAGKLLGPLSQLRDIAAAVKPDRIIVGFVDRRKQMPIAELLQLRYAGVPIEEAPTAYEQLCGRVQLSELHPSLVLFSPAFRRRSEWLIYQTLANWLLAFFLAVLSGPLLLLGLVLLKLNRRGPVLSRTRRVGLSGKHFTLYSLRLTGGQPGNPNFAERFVRRWGLHTLPRLWNILLGDMCFVGPRADRPEFAEILCDLIPFYRQRYRVKPGLTGWAQINVPTGRPEDTLFRLEYDFYYLKNRSRGLDTYILVHALRELVIARNPL